jgi:hypothetical protein
MSVLSLTMISLPDHHVNRSWNRSCCCLLWLVLQHCDIWSFSSSSNLSHVIRDFYTFKIGPEVVVGARWRPRAEIASRFGSPILILYSGPLEIFIYILPFKSYSSVWIWVEIWHSDKNNLGYSGSFDPEMLFPINATPKRHFLTENQVLIRHSGVRAKARHEKITEKFVLHN